MHRDNPYRDKNLLFNDICFLIVLVVGLTVGMVCGLLYYTVREYRNAVNVANNPVLVATFKK